MPKNKRPLPRLSLDHGILVGETIEQVTCSQLGMWLRGAAWAAHFGKDHVPHRVLVTYGSEQGRSAEDLDCDVRVLLAAELLDPSSPDGGPYLFGRLGLDLIVPTRQTIPAATRAAVIERDRNRCRRCRSTSPLTIDHIIPVSRGGTNDIANLQTLCGPCNSSKGARV